MTTTYPFALIEEGHHYDTKYFESAEAAIEYAASNLGEYELNDETIWVDVKVEIDLDVMTDIIVDHCPTAHVINYQSFVWVSGTTIRALKQVCPPETGITVDRSGIKLDFDAYLRWETVNLDPPEPECLDGHDHDWRSPHEVVGGIEENPGVWSSGGGVLIKEVCAHCGMYRITDTWAQDRSTGQQGLESVTYADPDEISEAWVSRDEDD